MCNTWVALTLHLGPGLQHWFTNPYVQTLRYHPARGGALPNRVLCRTGCAIVAATVPPFPQPWVLCRHRLLALGSPQRCSADAVPRPQHH